MKKIKTDKLIKLCLVLEVEPYHWSQRQLPSVDPARECREIWHAFFQECMADAGILGIEPIQPGSFFVDAFSVVKNELIVRMIQEELEESDFPSEDGQEDLCDIDTVSAFSGGYAIVSGDNVLLEPQCCCDFSNLDNWKQVLLEQPKNGTVWIGHPEAEVSFINNVVTIKEGWEYPPPPDYLAEFSFHYNDLKKAIIQAEKDKKILLKQVHSQVGKLVANHKLAQKITFQLMGLR